MLLLCYYHYGLTTTTYNTFALTITTIAVATATTITSPGVPEAPGMQALAQNPDQILRQRPGCRGEAPGPSRRPARPRPGRFRAAPVRARPTRHDCCHH